MTTPTSKRITLPDARIKKATRKLMGQANQGKLEIESSQGTLVVKMEIQYLNQDFLFGLRETDLIELEIVIRRKGEIPISQPHLPGRRS